MKKRLLAVLLAMLMMLTITGPVLTALDALAEQVTTPTDLTTPAPTKAPSSGKRSGYAVIRAGAKVYTSRQRTSTVGTVTADSYVYILTTTVSALTYKVRFDTSLSVGLKECHTYYVLSADVDWLSSSESDAVARQLTQKDTRRVSGVRIPVISFDYRNPPATPKPTATPEPTATPRPTATPEPTATPKPTATPEPTATPKPTATPEPTATPRPSRVPVITPTPKPVATAKPGPTMTPGATVTPAPVMTPGATATPKPAATPCPSRVPVITPTPKPVATATPDIESGTDQATPVPTVTPVLTPTPAATAVEPTPAATTAPVPTATPVPSRVPIITPGPAPTATPAITTDTDLTAPASTARPGIATGTDLVTPAPSQALMTTEEMRALLDVTHPDRQVSLWTTCTEKGYPNGSCMTMYANVSGYDGLVYSVVWEVDRGDGQGYVNAGNDGDSSISFIINDENARWKWRVGVKLDYMEK